LTVLLKQHRYVVQIGIESHLLRIEERVSGLGVWRGKFRVQIPATTRNEATTIYGRSADEVAAAAARFLDYRRRESA
jgi:hypothetical protein